MDGPGWLVVGLGVGFVEGFVLVGLGWFGALGGVGDFVGFWTEDIEVWRWDLLDGEGFEFHDEGCVDHARVGDLLDSPWEVVLGSDEPAFFGVGSGGAGSCFGFGAGDEDDIAEGAADILLVFECEILGGVEFILEWVVADEVGEEEVAVDCGAESSGDGGWADVDGLLGVVGPDVFVGGVDDVEGFWRGFGGGAELSDHVDDASEVWVGACGEAGGHGGEGFLDDRGAFS